MPLTEMTEEKALNTKKGMDLKTTTAFPRELDWPLITSFAIGYFIAWGMISRLGRIAQQSGVAD